MVGEKPRPKPDAPAAVGLQIILNEFLAALFIAAAKRPRPNRIGPGRATIDSDLKRCTRSVYRPGNEAIRTKAMRHRGAIR